METNQTPDPAAGEISAYHDEIAQIQQEGYQQTIKKARNMLFVAAGLIMLQYAIAIAYNPDIVNVIDMGIMVFFVGSFVALAFWTKKKPYTAIVGGIVVFILFIVFTVAIGAIFEGGLGAFKNLVSGWWIKILIFVALIKPLKDAKELQEMMEQKS
jgi:pheromone shutdown protein TraB